jgi:branched-subunit amino acid transport protein
MSGDAVLAGILLLGAATLAFKLVGPLSAGRVTLPPILARAAELLPVALIAGLVVTQTFDGGTLDAKVLGVLAAGVAVAIRAPFAVVVLVGAVTAAVLRASGFA